ncbi:MAG TPA: tRNA glutamyl-Q(34) synthetase GluQRS [Gammaproteobacteria bacterium]|nr:tRNA glutamyl-Q(34) synthetase GluQRS [Gammaproteobacteria bacterium]
MTDYVGRFAPAPSGPLHFGSIVAALGSYLQAKSQHGEWLVRIEDSDRFRVVEGATELILNTLEQLGLTWDGEVVIQSQREDRYREELARLQSTGLVYPCTCTRRETRGKPYPGTCRNGPSHNRTNSSLRIRTDDTRIEFEDTVTGKYIQSLEDEVGDFIIRRADGMTAYHLAVIIDDTDQGVTEVVRGADLIDSTPRQIYLQRMLEYSVPGYLHLPVAIDDTGRKISKQNNAPGIDVAQGARVLTNALAFLGQKPDPQLADAAVSDVIRWGLDHWDVSIIPAGEHRPSDKN